MKYREICDRVGKEIEGWSYEKLRRPAEEISFDREIEGQTFSFSLEAFNENVNGDLHICVDCRPEKASLFRAYPSYVFWKRRDGSVSY